MERGEVHGDVGLEVVYDLRVITSVSAGASFNPGIHQVRDLETVYRAPAAQIAPLLASRTIA
jgi:hypothetical protein